MRKKKPVRSVCSRDHVFFKSSDCPVCPQCWSGYYKKRVSDDLPPLAAPALRALLGANIMSLETLSEHSEKQILALHGMGPRSIPLLRRALKAKGLSFKKL